MNILEAADDGLFQGEKIIWPIPPRPKFKAQRLFVIDSRDVQGLENKDYQPFNLSQI